MLSTNLSAIVDFSSEGQKSKSNMPTFIRYQYC